MNAPHNAALYDLLPDYALGLLEGAELAQLEAALQNDPDLRQVLAKYESITEGLALALPQRQPSARVAAKLMAQIAPKTVIEGPPRANTERWRYYALAVAALMLVAFAVLALIGNLSDPDPIAQVLRDSERSEIAFTGQGESPIWGKLVLAGDSRTAVLRLESLPVLSNEQAYQVWLVGEGELFLSAAVFRNSQPKQDIHLRLPEDFRTAIQAVGMTIEPAGGSPAPTSDPIVVVAME
jgi:anti-sigma-K factor RskA